MRGCNSSWRPFHAAGSHALVAADECPINSPKLNEAHRAPAETVREAPFPGFPREIELFTDEERVLVHAPRAARPLAAKFFALCAERIDGVARQLTRLRPKRMHLVSCDPATLGRDLRALLAGGYALESLTLIDLFPQTAKLETIAALRRA